MYYPLVKEIAMKMRKEGTSFGDISKRLKINKSTLSFWFKNIILSESAIKKIKTKSASKSVQALLRYSESRRQERLQRNVLQKREGVAVLGDLSERDILLAGLGLYWGEGYKYENGELGFTNSNPLVIRFYFKWLKLWNVEKDSLIFRLTINEFFRKEEINIKRFWINFLEIQEGQFSKTTYIKTSLKKASMKNIENYKGILRVKVRRGTALRNRILGAIDHISGA